MRLSNPLSGDTEVQAAVLGTGCRYSGGEAGGRGGQITSLFLCFALSALMKIWRLRSMWRLLDKACIQVVQEHTVTYLFLNCRTALNSLHTVIS